MRKRAVAIVGLGMAVQPHARSLHDLDDRVEVRWAYSRSEERCQQFVQQYSWPVTTDFDRILDDASIDAVLLLTPPATHLQLGAACLRAGKHVLVEKPVAIDTPQAEQLVALADYHDRNLGVVLQHRFRANSLALAELIAAGGLGDICAGHCQIPWWRDQNYYDEPGRGTMARDGGGVLMTQAIHTLDLFRCLMGGDLRVLGSITDTTALHDMETEDFAAAVMRTGTGAPANLMATTAAYPGFPESIEIIGSKGTARLEETSLHAFFHDGTEQHSNDDWEPTSRDDPMDFPYEAHLSLITDFLDAIENNRAPQVSGRDALETHRLIDAIIDNSRAGS